MIQWMQYTRVNNKQKKLVWITWGIFEIKQTNILMSTNSYNQKAPLPQPSTILRGRQICVSVLNTAHRQFTIISKDKYQVQWTLILLTRKTTSTINKAKIKTKTLKDNYLKFNVWRKLSQISNPWKKLLTLITWEL